MADRSTDPVTAAAVGSGGLLPTFGRLAAGSIVAITLVICGIARANVPSTCYLVLGLLLCLAPNPWIYPLQQRFHWLLNYTALGVSLTTCVARVAAQIALAAEKPYGSMLPLGSERSLFWMQLGFARLDTVWIRVLRWVLPDIVVLLVAVFMCFWVRSRLSPLLVPPQVSRLHLFESAVWQCLLLFGVSLGNPSILNSVYWLIALIWCLIGALVPTVDGWRQWPAQLGRATALYAGVHLFVIQLRQFYFFAQWNRHQVRAAWGLPEFLDNTQYINNSDPATEAPFTIEIFWGSAHWLQWASVACLFVLMVAQGHFFRRRPACWRHRMEPNETTPLLSLEADNVRVGNGSLLPVKTSGWQHHATRVFIHFSHTPALFGMLLWAVLFPSWFGLVMLLAVCWLVLNPPQLSLRLSPIGALWLGLLTALEFIKDISGVVQSGSSQFDFDRHDLDRNAWELASKVAIFCVVAVISSLRHTFLARLGTAAMRPSSSLDVPLEHTEDGEVTANTPPPPRVSWYRRLIKQLGHYVVHYTYLGTYIIIYAASLEDVNLLNAGYLVFLIVFWVFQRVRLAGWIFLVLYAVAVNVLLYLWGFPMFRGVCSQSTLELTGLDEDSHEHMWHTLRWQLVILLFSIIQLLATRYIRTGRNPLPRTNSESLAALSLPVMIEQLCCLSWSFVSYLTLLLCGALGDVTLIKLGYLGFSFLLLATFRLHAVKANYVLWFFTLLYAGAAFLLKYMYQFGDVRDWSTKVASDKWLEAAGFRVKTSQFDLFVYLLPASLLLVVCLIKTRIADSHTRLDLGFSYVSPRWRAQWNVAVQACKRCLILSLPIVANLLVLATAFFPRVQLVGLLTVGLLATAFCLPALQPIVSVSVMVWLQLVVLGKLVYQLDIIEVPSNLETVNWAGFWHLDQGGRDLSVEFLAILAIALQGFFKTWASEVRRASSRQSVVLFLISAEDSRTYVASAMKDALNGFVRSYGFEMCIFLATITSFIRLNFVGLVYMLVVGVLLRSFSRLHGSPKQWRLVVVLVAVLVVAQYVASLGLPPGSSYPYEDWAAQHDSGRALLRYMYFPPINNSLPSAPPSWQDPHTLYADSVLLVCSAVYLRSLLTARTAPRSNVYGGPSADPMSLWLISCKLAAAVVFRVLLLLCAGLTALSRSDLLSYGLVIAVMYLFHMSEAKFQCNEDRCRVWKRLQILNYVILILRLVWILVAVAVDWHSVNGGIFDLLDVFGLRYGLDLQLKANDPRVSVWAANDGLVFDLLLFGMLLVMSRMLQSGYSEEVGTMLRTAMENSRWHSKMFINDMLERIRAKQSADQQQTAVAQRLLAMVQEKSAISRSTVRLDVQAAKWFTSMEVSDNISRSAGAKHGLVDVSLPPSRQPSEDLTADGHPTESSSEVVKEKAQTEDQLRQRRIVDNGDSQTATPRTTGDKGAQDDLPDTDGDAKKQHTNLGWRDRAINLARQLKRKAASSFIALVIWMNHSTAVVQRIYYADPCCMDNFEASSTLLRNFLQGLYFLLVAHTDVVCSIMVVFNVCYNANLLAVVYPLMLFMWGTLSRPFPTHRFWQALLYYTEAVILVKYAFQFQFWGTFNDAVSDEASCDTSLQSDQCFTVASAIGITREKTHILFLIHVLPDLLQLVAIFLHRSAQMRLGIWKMDGKAMLLEQRRLEEESGKGSEHTPEVREETDGQELPTRHVPFTPSQPATLRIKLKKLPSRALYFFRMLESSVGTSRADYYVGIFLVEFVALLVVIFGWSGFSKANALSTESSAASFIQQNNIPILFLLYLLLQFILIVMDRAIYLLRWFRAKLVLHYGILLFVHALVFYILPRSTYRPFRTNTVVILWYLLKVIYFALSSAQLKAHYPDRVLQNYLTERTTRWRSLLFTVYMNIPFLYELRAILDWACTSTTLTMLHWLKLEDIYNQLYTNLVRLQTITREGRRRGQQQSLVTKTLYGPLLLLLLFVVLWFPLLFMSLVNTSSVSNPPRTGSLRLQLFTFEAIFDMDDIPHPVTPEQYGQLQALDQSDFVDRFHQSDVHHVLLSPQSKTVWQISPSSQKSLENALVRGIGVTLTVSWTFERTPQVGVIERSVGSVTHKLPDKGVVVQNLLAAINGTAVVNLERIFPTFFRLDSTGTADTDRLPSAFADHWSDCALRRQEDETTFAQWWNVNQTSPHFLISSEPQPPSSGIPYKTWIELIIFSDRIIPPHYSFVSSYGIIGLYVSVVLVVGKFLRMAVAHISHKIPYEHMPQVQTLMNVCSIIYLARQLDPPNLVLEEDLFSLLVEIYRSPEAIIVWTDLSLINVNPEQ